MTLSGRVAPECLRTADGRTLLALRWYEHALEIEEPEDRYLALWIALEALAGGPGTDFLKRAWDLVLTALGGPSHAGFARTHVDLRTLRDLRNRIVVGTGRELAPASVRFTVSRGTLAILAGLIEDTLRRRLSLARADALAAAIAAGRSGPRP